MQWIHRWRLGPGFGEGERPKIGITCASRNFLRQISEWPYLDLNFYFSSQNSWWPFFSPEWYWNVGFWHFIYDDINYFRNIVGRKQGPSPTSNLGGDHPLLPPLSLRPWVDTFHWKRNGHVWALRIAPDWKAAQGSVIISLICWSVATVKRLYLYITSHDVHHTFIKTHTHAHTYTRTPWHTCNFIIVIKIFSMLSHTEMESEVWVSKSPCWKWLDIKKFKSQQIYIRICLERGKLIHLLINRKFINI